MKSVPLMYRSGFSLLCAALAVFLFGEMVAGNASWISQVLYAASGSGALLLIMAGIADALLATDDVKQP